MALRLPELWTVVLSLAAVVNAARNQNCLPPNITNGFFISERDTFAHDTELYYGCNVNFKPVEGTWWATVTCQNGNWSSSPQCIEDTACFDPEIPNANYIAFPYMQHGGHVWIRCNGGYEDKGRQGRAVCENGQWKGLPICEKLDNSWCEPPPQIPNAVLINEDYKDLFPEAGVKYMCRSGFEFELDSNTAYCTFGNWINLPSCREKQGHVPPPTTASPIPSQSNDNIQPLFTTINRCGSLPVVTEGVVSVGENKMHVSYKCSYYFKLRGNSIVRCTNGQWTTPPTCEVNYCKLDTTRDPELENTGVAYVKSGFYMKLDCVNDSWYKPKKTKRAKCTNNQLSLSECCYSITHNTDFCDYSPINPSQ